MPGSTRFLSLKISVDVPQKGLCMEGPGRKLFWCKWTRTAYLSRQFASPGRGVPCPSMSSCICKVCGGLWAISL